MAATQKNPCHQGSNRMDDLQELRESYEQAMATLRGREGLTSVNDRSCVLAHSGPVIAGRSVEFRTLLKEPKA